jgi:hypothetical protein
MPMREWGQHVDGNMLLMPSSLNQKCRNGLFSQLLACLQPMETFYENKARAILPYKNRTLQSDLKMLSAILRTVAGLSVIRRLTGT